MSSILLTQTYYLRFDQKSWDAMQPYPPLGTLYAAAVLRQHGYHPALFDVMLAESEDQWAQALDQIHPKYAIFYEDNFNYLSKMCLLRMRQAAFHMIAAARSRGCVVLVCGADASDHAADYLTSGASYILVGEGEETLVELLDSLEGRMALSPENILGLAYLQAGKTHQTPRRPDIRSLDALPFPAWDLLDIQAYREAWLNRHGYFSLNVVTTRGCPFHCNWCAKPIWGQRYNSRSPENVIAEVKWLQINFAPDHIWFADDIFGLKPGWLEKFAQLAESQGVRIPFKCLSRADLLVRPGEVAALQRAGAKTVWIGAESGSQKILDAMDKGTRVEQIAQVSRMLQAHGIEVGFFLQFGYPGETLEDIEKTLQMVRDCSPNDIGISVSYPMPGTQFFNAVQAQMGVRQNWYDSNDLAMLYQGPFSTAFYRQLHSLVHHEFRARKACRQLRSQPTLQVALRSALRLAYNLSAWPAARWRLNRLAKQANPPLQLPHLAPEQAAAPTPQESG